MSAESWEHCAYCVPIVFCFRRDVRLPLTLIGEITHGTAAE